MLSKKDEDISEFRATILDNNSNIKGLLKKESNNSMKNSNIG